MRKLAAALLLLLLSAVPASAASPHKTQPTIVLNESNVALGDDVTFTTTIDKTVKNPRIGVDCYQNNVLVFGMGGSNLDAFQLGGASSDWLRNGGPADCVATLFHFDNSGPVQTYVAHATTSFHAEG